MKTNNLFRKCLFTSAIAYFANLALFAQVDVKWKKDLSSPIHWQEVTSLGNLIVSSGNQLAGVDTESGSINWSKIDLAGISRDAYSKIPNSPFFTIAKGNSIMLIDEFSGALAFDSEKAGLKTIEDYFFLYRADAILIAGTSFSGDPIMVSVRMSSGKVSWSMNEKFGRIVAATELNDQELLVVTLFNNYKINALSGKIIWKAVNSSEAAQLDKLGAFGALMKSAAENTAKDMEFELRYYRPEGGDLFYIGSQQESQSGMTSSTGTPTVNYKNVYNAYRISDGGLVWNKSLEVSGKLGHVAFLKNGMLILPDDGNRTKINLYDYASQQGIWGKKGNGIAIKGGVYDYIETGNGILLVTQTSSNNFLNYLDPATGMITFEKPVQVDGRVVGIVPLSSGILYITTESMNILDPVTGTLKWAKSVTTSPELTARHDGKIYAFDYKAQKLMIVDEATESVRPQSDFQLKFLGGESPRNLEMMEDGIFLYSDQNVAKYDFEGRVKFQEYYPAPKESGWKKALLYAEAVRGAYVGASAYYVSGVMASVEDDVKKEDAAAGEMVSQISNAYGDLGNYAVGYAATAMKKANTRFKATQSGRDFMFIMSVMDKSVELLMVSKTTGKVDGRINLGKDKEPVYAVDDVTGQVYYLEGDKLLTSYQVK
jgi:outer membrane protein assembly factor BamB